MKYTPLTDGADHINIYSNAKTQLGKLLSNFTFCTLVTEEDGAFSSIEGYWYWLLAPINNFDREKLRDLYGFEAKKVGQNLIGGDWPKAQDLNLFKTKIKQSMKLKLEQNPVIKEMFIKSELPFTHYYVFDNRIVKAKGCKWILEEWERLRKEMKDGK